MKKPQAVLADKFVAPPAAKTVTTWLFNKIVMITVLFITIIDNLYSSQKQLSTFYDDYIVGLYDQID